MEPVAERTPGPLVVASGLVALEAAVMAVLTVLELAAVTSGRVMLGLTTALFFALSTAALAWCAWGLWRLRSWARGPVMMVQLLLLGMAYSVYDRDVWWVSALLVVVALGAAVSILHPASLAAMSEDQPV